MACSDYAADWPMAGIEALTNGNFMDGVLCPFQMQLGGLVIGLLVFGVLAVALTVRTGTVVTPLVVFIFVGSIIVTQLPSFAITFAVIVLMLGIPMGGYLLVRQLNTP